MQQKLHLKRMQLCEGRGSLRTRAVVSFVSLPATLPLQSLRAKKRAVYEETLRFQRKW